MFVQPRSVAVRAQALESMRKGATAGQLQTQFQVSKTTAEAWLKDFRVGRFAVKPKRSRHSVHVRAQALALFESKKSYKAVARELSLPMYTVRDWYRQYQSGLFMPEPYRALYTRPGSLEREEVLGLAQQGLSHNAIVKATKVKLQTVRSWLR